MESAQNVLKADKKITENIEKLKAEVDAKVGELCNLLRLSQEEVFGALLMSFLPGRPFGHMHDLKVFQVFMVLTEMIRLSFGSGSIFWRGMGAFAVVSGAGIAKVLGTVLKGVAAGAFLIPDIYFLVKTSMDLSNGSHSDAAGRLREVATKLEKQASDLEVVLEKIRDETAEYMRKLLTKLRKLLEKVSVQQCAIGDDANQVFEIFKMYSSREWQQAFQLQNINLNLYVTQIANVFKIFGRSMEDHLRNNKQLRHLEITIIAHGRIDLLARVPNMIYYLMNMLESITFYSPWGRAVDEYVVYGIATNTISIPNVRYSGPVHPGLPSNFNVLPANMELTPNVILSPVMNGEGAHMALEQLTALLQGHRDGLVIPYFTGVGNDLLPFPEIPLWVCSNAVAICGLMLNVKVRLRIAACLCPADVGSISTLLGQDGMTRALRSTVKCP